MYSLSLLPSQLTWRVHTKHLERDAPPLESGGQVSHLVRLHAHLRSAAQHSGRSMARQAPWGRSRLGNEAVGGTALEG